MSVKAKSFTDLWKERKHTGHFFFLTNEMDAMKYEDGLILEVTDYIGHTVKILSTADKDVKIVKINGTSIKEMKKADISN